MDSVYQAYPQRGTNGVSFTLTNIGETKQVVYLRDMTLYTLLRNIDHTNNCFSWIEERPISTLASHVTTINENGEQVSITEDIADKKAQNPSITKTISDYTNLSHCHVLCCLRIPPGAYTDIPSLVNAINDHLSSTMTSQPLTTSKRRLPCALNGIEYVHRTDAGNRRPGFKFSISSEWWEKTDKTYTDPQDGEARSIYVPTVRITPAVLQDPLYLSYDSSIKSTLYRNTILNGNQPPCIVMTKNSLYMPPLHDSSVSLYNMNSKNVISSNGSLTKQTIDFPSAISNKLGLQPFILPNNTLFYTYDDAVRIYDNGFDYTEFLIDSYALDLQTLSKYYVNTIIYGGTPVTTEGSKPEGTGTTGGSSDSTTPPSDPPTDAPAEASLLAIPRSLNVNQKVYTDFDRVVMYGGTYITTNKETNIVSNNVQDNSSLPDGGGSTGTGSIPDKPTGEELMFYSYNDLYKFGDNYYAIVINRPGQTDVNYVNNQPFFPPSNRLFIRSTRLSGIDSFVESQYRDERLIKNALAVIDLDPTAYVTTNGYIINDTAVRPTKELINEIKIQHVTIDINANMTIPPGQSQTIYITGSNQTYPLERGPHVLTYSIID